MESYHNNEKEDRKYSVFFQSSKIRDDWILTDCVMDIQVNVWDGDIDVVLHSNQVIAGNEYGYLRSKATTINCLCQSLKSAIYNTLVLGLG